MYEDANRYMARSSDNVDAFYSPDEPSLGTSRTSSATDVASWGGGNNGSYHRGSANYSGGGPTSSPTSGGDRKHANSLMNFLEVFQAKEFDDYDSISGADDAATISSNGMMNSFLDKLPGNPQSGSSRCLRVMTRLIKIVVLVFLPVYIGAVLVMFCVDRHRRAQPLFINTKDHVVLGVVGVMLQLSIIPLFINMLPNAKRVFHDLDSPSDHIAPFALYPISSLFLCVVAVLYRVLDRKAQRNKYRHYEVSARRKSKLQAIYQHLTGCVTFRSLWIIPGCTALSAVVLVACRFCDEVGAGCKSGNQLWNRKYYTEPFFWSGVGFQFALLCNFTMLVSLGLGMYWQHLRLVQVFTFPEKYGARPSAITFGGGGGQKRDKPKSKPTKMSAASSDARKKGFFEEIDWHDLGNPEGIANYNFLYNTIIASMNAHPVMIAVCAPCFVMSILLFLGTGSYIVFENMVNGNAWANFTFVFLALLIMCAVAVSLFVYYTVQLDKTVAVQSRIIAKVQNDVQQQVDHVRGLATSSAHALKALEAKVNALQALDVCIRHTDSTPKLIGLSLNTIRWVSIFVLLVFINAFLMALYLIFCRGNNNTTRTVSSSFSPTKTISH